MQGDHDAEKRRQLKMAMRADPDARLKMDSANSSKPPSSDGYGKPSAQSQCKRSGRKSGGQKGHRGNFLSKAEQPDRIERVTQERCPVSGVELDDSYFVDSIARQVFELPETKLEVTEYRACVYEFPKSEPESMANFPRRRRLRSSTACASTPG